MKSLFSRSSRHRSKKATDAAGTSDVSNTTGSRSSREAASTLRPGDLYNPSHPAVHPPPAQTPASAPASRAPAISSASDHNPKAVPSRRKVPAPASRTTDGTASSSSDEEKPVPTTSTPSLPIRSSHREPARDTAAPTGHTAGPGWTHSADTTVDRKTAPAVVHETIVPHRHEIIQKHVTKEIHEHHVVVKRQPVFDTQVLPPRHFTHDDDGVLVQLEGLQMGAEWEAAWKRSIVDAVLQK